MPKIY